MYGCLKGVMPLCLKHMFLPLNIVIVQFIIALLSLLNFQVCC